MILHQKEMRHHAFSFPGLVAWGDEVQNSQVYAEAVAPLVDAARALRRLGAVSILLIAGATAAMITLAANAALAANAQVIEVLRLVGALDSYIAHAFVRRFTLRALGGAAAGVGLGMIGVWLMPSASNEGGFLTGLGFQGWAWGLPLLIPPLGALVAFAATTRAANKRLGDLT